MDPRSWILTGGWYDNRIMDQSFTWLVVILCLVGALPGCSIPTGQATPTTAPVARLTSTPVSTVPPPLHTSSPTWILPSPTARVVTQVTVYLVLLEDAGKNGIPIGCGDSLVAVNNSVEPTTDAISAALARLFSYKSQFINETGLYTALYQSNLVVQSIEYGVGGDVWVALAGEYQLGGVFDNPRFHGQIEQTILAASGASAVNVTINGRPLREIVSNR